MDQLPQSRLTQLSLHSGEGNTLHKKSYLIDDLMTYLGQSSNSLASSFWRTEASCLRSTTRSTEQSNRRSGSLKAQKTSTGVFLIWFVNYYTFESHYRLQNIQIFTFLGEPHGRVDPFKGVRLCHQVCRASQVLRVTSGLFLELYPLPLCRILISGGYFGPNSSTSKTLSEDQAFIGRLLTIFQCGINYNQHG